MTKWIAILLLSASPSFAVESAANHSTVIEEFLRMRDPFKRPVIENAKVAVKSELEMFATDSFKLTGVMTGPERMRAMLLGPDGKTRFVHEQMRIGLRGGIVKRIEEDSVLVREKMVNLLGQEELVDTVIPLHIADKPEMNADKSAGVPADMNARNEVGAGSP